MVVRRLLTSLAVAAPLTLPVAGVAATCYTPSEATAVHIRMLQSELMVAALACRDSNPELGMISQYNAFVHRHGERLSGQNRILQRHFGKHYGAQWQRQMDSFVTALANDASKRSMTPDFCRGAASLFGQIAVLDWRGLEVLSSDRAAGNGTTVAACTASGGARSEAVRR